MNSSSVSTEHVIDEIVGFDWPRLSQPEMLVAAWAYYFFSVQFREHLELACDFFPEDLSLRKLKAEECETDNLSPYPGVAALGERLDHDEFMRRSVQLSWISEAMRQQCQRAGQRYLQRVREAEPMTRALSIASYENGGLERLFRAMLTAPGFDDLALQAFRFFMIEHIRFDSDQGGAGHGELSRQLPPCEDVAELWMAFRDLLLELTPQLALVQS